MTLSLRLLSCVLTLGGCLVLAGAAAPIAGFSEAIAFYLFAPGALLFAAAQTLSRLPITNSTLRRLRRQQLLGAALIVAAAVMFFMHLRAIRPCTGDEWKLALIIAALLEIYTSFRIPAEIEKANRK